MKNKQLILKELLEIIELFPDVNISQHLVCIMRPAKDSYFWSDEFLLKKVERYRAELENESDGE